VEKKFKKFIVELTFDLDFYDEKKLTKEYIERVIRAKLGRIFLDTKVREA
jgi:hypothetical protein